MTDRSGSLRAQALDAEEIRKAAGRLCGERLPDIWLTSADGVRVPLLAHVDESAVLYFVPGEHDGATRVDGFPTRDATHHKAYVNRLDRFNDRRIKVLAVASQPLADVRRISQGVGIRHIVLADPELQLGHALRLPLSAGSGGSRYPRLAIIASNGTIDATLPDGNARQVLTWIAAHQ
jgi:peroxiredoxin